MQELITYLISKITGSSDFEVEEREESGKLIYTVTANPSIIGLIIGKGGKTIKNLRKIASIRAVVENKAIHIAIEEKAS